MPKTRATRTGHTKSRNGCIRCKKRHVKCDEQRPCGQCVRHHAECSLAMSSAASLILGQQPLTPQDSPSTDGRRTSPADNLTSGLGDQTHGQPEVRAQPSPALPRDKTATIMGLLHDLMNEIKTLDDHPSQSPSAQPTQHAPTPTPAAAPAPPPGWISPGDWMEDLHLLYYFSTSVYKDLTTKEHDSEMWKCALPQMAFSNNALMHGLLALSALHYGHVHPDQREAYQLLSSRHQSIAIDSLSGQLHSINQDNCQAAILLAALIFIIKTFSISDQYNHGSPVTIPDLAQSFLLLQGVRSILTIPNAYHHAATSGPLSPLLTRVTPSHNPSGPFIARGDRLLTLARTVFAHGPAALDARAALVLAVEALRHTCAVLQADPPPGRIWAWGIGVPGSFLEMLGKGSAAALAVLAHFAALVERAEGRRWHVRGWAEGVVEAVERGLEAGMGEGEEGAGEWRELVRWPVRCVRERIDIMSVAEGEYVGEGGAGAQVG